MKLKTVKQKKASNKKRVLKNSNGHMNNVVNILPYKVKDISLSKLGRDKIGISEKEMPGLMSLRKKHAKSKP